jgi:hypothetical protein
VNKVNAIEVWWVVLTGMAMLLFGNLGLAARRRKALLVEHNINSGALLVVSGHARNNLLRALGMAALAAAGVWALFLPEPLREANRQGRTGTLILLMGWAVLNLVEGVLEWRDGRRLVDLEMRRGGQDPVVSHRVRRYRRRRQRRGK